MSAADGDDPNMAQSFDRIQLVVTHMDNQVSYFTVPDTGWKLDPIHRQILIGRGIDRVMVPLDNVRSYAMLGFNDPGSST